MKKVLKNTAIVHFGIEATQTDPDFPENRFKAQMNIKFGENVSQIILILTETFS
jgi:hypothetical protein